MDLLPKPDQVVSATGNVAHKLLYGGLADLRPMPRVLIDDGQLREVYHYRPDPAVPETGDPVLLVTPLAAPSSCFDLRRGCSLVEHFVAQGRPTYLVEYGQVSFRDRNLGMEHWISEVVPTAIREVAAHAGGRSVHVVGWSLGGIFAALTVAHDPALPVASLTVLGSPFDLSKVPLIAPLRPLLNLNLPPQLRAVTRAYQTLGGAPRPLVRWAFQLTAFQKLVTKPLALVQHLDDTEFLAQVEAVDDFTANMIAYPGRSFGQLYHRMYRGNALLSGTFELDTPDAPGSPDGTTTIHLSEISCPVLVFAGATDGIAPVSAVRPLTELLTGAREVGFEVVPGGHLGMLTGRAARTTTWVALDEWLDRWSTPRPLDGSEPDPDAPPSAPRADRIGSNRTRRYGSAASRAFG
ncbi:alpha/beta fold hydrolase [Nocardioides zeae]|uniref:Alpha/beta fold hydrolase n=1 Tax=Nocardioides imazamoxiresistens TaxID=3231893 RepID=A0ABU3PYG3_9ACTN|nr:alpha/beta fold hydrolase [Nocardioides zeae]MDT9594184.1 alpha/beta fold hydrolase [Nocardioides zeae]